MFPWSTDEFHSLSEINKPPISDDNAKIVDCIQCDFITRHKDELKIHIQVKHKIVKVNIAKEDHIMIACDQCNFKCRLNIQLKKHLKTSHEVRYKYNCKECAFTANLVADFWKHSLTKHPDDAIPYDGNQFENMTLKIMAEQNVDLGEEIETLKKDMKGACEQLANIFESGMAAMKEDTDNKCKMMADTILKLYKKMSKLDPKASKNLL